MKPGRESSGVIIPSYRFKSTQFKPPPPPPHRRLCHQAPNGFGLNPPSQLVIEYQRLAFLNHPQFARNFEYNIDHISKFVVYLGQGH